MTDCFPILGGTSLEQLKSNIEALRIVLTPAPMDKLNDAAPFDHGYPTGQFGLDPRLLPGQQPTNNMLNTVSLRRMVEDYGADDQAGYVRYTGWP